MITLTSEQREKIVFLDKLFGSMSTDQLKEITESEQVVARLKGIDQNPMILQKLIDDNQTLSLDLINLRNDVKDLIKVLNTTVFTVPYSQDFQTLKNKHSIY
jgi:hypothetical protein